ncbi:MAG TPA: VWA domain-containing protein [Pyrinomonadaceae bacterium]|jgi:VWFA-related protein
MKKDLAHLLALVLFMSQAPAAGAAGAWRQTPAPGQQPATRQQPQPTPTPAPQDDDDVVRITTNLVQFDAVVTDKQGRLVTDLHPDEFEVLLEGKRQEISNFAFVNTAPPSSSTTAATERATGARADKGAPPPPPVPVRAGNARRTIALVVDDLGTSATDIYYVKRALRKFVDEQMQPGDLAAVVLTGKGLGALQQFTSDKQLLHRAIDAVRWNPLGRAGMSSFAPIEADPLAQAGGEARGGPGGAGAPPSDMRNRDAVAAMEDVREGVFTVGTLGALDFIVRGMKELPGRKSVILFSGGFPIFGDAANPNETRDTDRVTRSLRRLTEQANRASVVIYTMDARGLAVTALTAADSPGNAQGALAALRRRGMELVNNQEGLSYLAEQTGGMFIRNQNDLGAGVRRVLEDQKGYYLIGFRPAAEVFERPGGQTRFNKFEVRVTRPGVRVRTRSGFYGYAEGEARPAPRTRSEQLLAALSSPLTSGGLGLRLTSLYNSTPEGAAVLDSLLHVDGSQISLADEPDGWKRAVFDVVALTFGEDGRVVDEINRTETLRVRGDVLEALLKDGFVYVMKVPVNKPGAYQLRVAVRDAANERVGSASQFIEVPDLKNERLALSGIFMTAADATDPAAPKKEGENAGGTDPLRDATVRRFRQGSAVDFRYHIYNAKVERATGRPQLKTQTRLFRDGQPVYASALLPYEPGPPTAPSRLEGGRRLQLGTQLPPGEYVLQVVVTDELAKGKGRTATQWIDFEILK